MSTSNDKWPAGMEHMQGLTQAAVGMNEIFKSLMEGGFTEKQALILVAEMVKTKDKE